MVGLDVLVEVVVEERDGLEEEKVEEVEVMVGGLEVVVGKKVVVEVVVGKDEVVEEREVEEFEEEKNP